MTGWHITAGYASRLLEEALTNANLRELFDESRKTAERVIPQIVKGGRERFLEHYRALYAQLREGDCLYFLAEMRKSEKNEGGNGRGIPVLKIILRTSGERKTEVGPILLPTGLLAGRSLVLYDYL
jgi:hypothetical protein